MKLLFFIEEGYFLHQELLQIHSEEYELIPFVWNHLTDIPKELVFKIELTQPDAILSVNYRGYDPQGHLFRLIQNLGVPQLVWFLDNPYYLLSQCPEFMFHPEWVFFWDSSYCKPFEKMSRAKIRYLPLATSNYFKGQGQFSTHGPTSFVGSSMSQRVHELRLSLEPVHPHLLELNLGRMLDFERGFQLGAFVESYLKSLDLKDALNYAPMANEFLRYRHTQIKRSELIKSFQEAQVYGDEGWGAILSTNKLFSPLNYYQELPKHFEASGIHLNLTHYQMPLGVNQRVFDVVYSGGVLLTDQQGDLLNLFPEWSEWSYSNLTEVYELHEKLKESKARDFFFSIREEIQSKHLYSHRLDTLVKATFA